MITNPLERLAAADLDNMERVATAAPETRWVTSLGRADPARMILLLCRALREATRKQDAAAVLHRIDWIEARCHASDPDPRHYAPTPAEVTCPQCLAAHEIGAASDDSEVSP